MFVHVVHHLFPEEAVITCSMTQQPGCLRLRFGAPPLAPFLALFRQRLRDGSSLQSLVGTMLNKSTRTSAVVTMRPLTTQWVRSKGSETAPG